METGNGTWTGPRGRDRSPVQALHKDRIKDRGLVSSARRYDAGGFCAAVSGSRGDDRALGTSEGGLSETEIR